MAATTAPSSIAERKFSGRETPTSKATPAAGARGLESDPQTRRAGMRFPNFWLIFFEQLVRNDRPSNTQVLHCGQRNLDRSSRLEQFK